MSDFTQKFINDKGYPSWTPLCRVVEAAEDNLFMSCFSNWPRPEAESLKQNGFNGPVPKDDEVKKPKVDLSGLYKRQNQGENGKEDDVKDDGSGKIKVCYEF